MLLRFVSVAMVAVASIGLAGCGPAKLDVNKTYTLDVGEAQAIDLPAIPKPQKITVEFSATAGDVTVLVFKESDAKGTDGLLDADLGKSLGKKTGKSDSFTVDVPENTATRVIARGATKKTDVTLKVTNTK
jgi:hypothetical protein